MKLFFVSQLDYIFFIYGFAFIMLFATVQSLKKLDDSGIKWGWLGWFALLHGTLEWNDLVAYSLGDSQIYKSLRLALMIASFIPLIEFARVNARIKRSVVIYYPLLALILLFYFIMQLNDVNAIARYSMAFVGAVWSAFVIIEKTKNNDLYLVYYKRIAIFLACYGLSSGIVVPSGSFFPSNILNQDTFLEFFSFPIQGLRAFFAVCIAYNAWGLWRKINAKKGSMFGVKPEAILDKVAFYTVFGLLIFGWITMEYSSESMTHIYNANDAVKALKEYRLSEIFETGVVSLLFVGLFIFIQNKVTSKLYLDISKKMLEALFVDSKNPMFVKNSDGRYMMANDAFCNLYGEYRLVGFNDGDFTERKISKIRIKDFEALNSGVFLTKDVLIENDGSEKVFQTSFSQVIMADNIMLVGVMTDITELKSAMEKLEKINIGLEYEVSKRLEELRQKDLMLIQQSKLAAMGEMIGNIAHQWRQPLNVLGLKIQDVPTALEFGEFSAEYAKQFTNDSMNMVEYMSQTIDDFRNFFKPEKEKVLFDVKERINMAKNLIDDGLRALLININVSFSNDNIIAYGYPNEFAQVIVNILNNAKDALTVSSSEHKNINLNVTINKDKIKILIEDNAGGIAGDILSKIFEPYFTTKHKAQGTGLGLYMSKLIIEQNMGGKLSAYNTHGGACFEIELPIADSIK